MGPSSPGSPQLHLGDLTSSLKLQPGFALELSTRGHDDLFTPPQIKEVFCPN